MWLHPNAWLRVTITSWTPPRPFNDTIQIAGRVRGKPRYPEGRMDASHLLNSTSD